MIVTTIESNQWRAVADPCAWNARRMGWEVESRGGSVVLGWSVQHVEAGLYACTAGGRLTRAADIGSTRSFGAVAPIQGHAQD